MSDRETTAADRRQRERDNARSLGMSDYIVKYGVIRLGLPFLVISILFLALEKRLRPMDPETFVLRILAPIVVGLLIARLGWANVVSARMKELDAVHSEEIRRADEEEDSEEAV